MMGRRRRINGEYEIEDRLHDCSDANVQEHSTAGGLCKAATRWIVFDCVLYGFTLHLVT
jgi:hypothetical protein